MSDSMIQPHVCIVADCHSFAAMGSNVLFVGAESDSVRKRSAPRTDGSCRGKKKKKGKKKEENKKKKDKKVKEI